MNSIISRINKEYNVILASKSPRRKELLALTGLNYSVIPSDAEEIITKDKPSDVVCELARLKALDVYNKCIDKENLDKNIDKSIDTKSISNPFVIGSDTIVAYGDRILGKPSSMQDAYDTLKLLQGNIHQVYTGVCIVYSCDGMKEPIVETFYDKTEVEFYPMTDEAIWEYVETKDPMDKAGAYGIQTAFSIHVKGIRGDYNNVVGLPIAKLYQYLLNTI